MLDLFQHCLKSRKEDDDRQKLRLSSGRTVPVRFRKNKSAKRIILRFDPTKQEVVVTLPSRASERQAMRFVDQHMAWIEEQVSKTADVVLLHPGAEVSVQGVFYKIAHDLSKRSGVTLDENRTFWVAGPEEHLPRRIKDYLKKQARLELTKAVKMHSEALGLSYNKITIRDTKSRWGSCAADGSLNFSWRLILAPREILNYVAAHEVAHLKEHNHSKAFWQIVTQLDPDWKLSRDWLHQYGADLHRYQ